MDRDVAISREDLLLLDRRMAKESEKRFPVAAELGRMAALRFLSAPGDTCVPFLQKAGQWLPPTALHEKCLPAHRTTVAPLLSAFHAQDRLALLQAFLSTCAQHDRPLTPAALLPPPPLPNERIAYMRSALTDDAYERLCTVLHAPTVLYTNGYREACEAVRDGSCGYCILPYENTEGVLHTFTALAERYSLLRTALCRVFHPDGSDTTHFALYGHRLPLTALGGTPLLHASLHAQDAHAIAVHMQAFALLGAEFRRTQTEAVQTEERGLCWTVTLRLSAQGLLPTLAYLTAFAPDWTLHGLYKEIEKI